MNEYIEKPDKNILTLTAPSRMVHLKVDCHFGTVSQVSFFHGTLKTVGCGENKIVGQEHKLQGTTLEFNGASGNPGGGKIKIVHTIYETDGNSITYTFPDDYTGSPDFDENDPEPSYVFYVKFL